MTFPHIQLPQIHRKISARFCRYSSSLFLYLIFGGILGLNIHQIQLQSSPLWVKRFAILRSPFNSKVHLQLAKLYWDLNNGNRAKTELTIADELTTKNHSVPESVLGSSSSVPSLLNEWNITPIKLEENYTYWRSIANEKPDYVDAYIISAVYAYKQKKIKTALSLISTALSLDPNDTKALLIQKTMQSNLLIK